MLLIALACVIAALALLGALSVIDLRTRLLPDKLVAPLLLTGIVFHWATGFYYTSGTEMLAGALIGGGLLLAVRFVANHFYQQDALGLGDVKLLAAAGVWLGPHDVLLAVILGAFAGIVNGLGLAVYQRLKSRWKRKYLVRNTSRKPGLYSGG